MFMLACVQIKKEGKNEIVQAMKKWEQQCEEIGTALQTNIKKVGTGMSKNCQGKRAI